MDRQNVESGARLHARQPWLPKLLRRAHGEAPGNQGQGVEPRGMAGADPGEGMATDGTEQHGEQVKGYTTTLAELHRDCASLAAQNGGEFTMSQLVSRRTDVTQYTLRSRARRLQVLGILRSRPGPGGERGRAEFRWSVAKSPDAAGLQNPEPVNKSVQTRERTRSERTKSDPLLVVRLRLEEVMRQFADLREHVEEHDQQIEAILAAVDVDPVKRTAPLLQDLQALRSQLIDQDTPDSALLPQDHPAVRTLDRVIRTHCAVPGY